MFRACNRSNIWVNRQYSTRDLAGTKHFFANLLRSESMMFMKQGLFPILLSCNGVGVTISVDLSRCQVANHLRFFEGDFCYFVPW